jgi:hypothetical protein
LDEDRWLLDLETIWDALQRGGALGLAVYIVWAFMTDRLVSGSQYQRLQKQRDRLFELALRASRAAEKSAGVTDQMIRSVRGDDELSEREDGLWGSWTDTAIASRPWKKTTWPWTPSSERWTRKSNGS